MKKRVNLHLVSDSTGETLISVSRAVLSQFEGIETNDFIWPLVRTKSQINDIIESIKNNPGIVLYTIIKEELISDIKEVCYEMQIPCIPILSRIITEFSNYLGMNINHTIGRQHLLDEDYFSRVDAINYSMSHDDGQLADNLYEADIVIIGVSRTSKSPTSIYLSCRGYKTANIPFVRIENIPDNIYDLKKPLIVGLIINPEKLIQIRQNRLISMGSYEKDSSYIDIESIKQEIAESRKLFSKLSCPIIDVTKSSVEETSAKIIHLLQKKRIAERNNPSNL